MNFFALPLIPLTLLSALYFRNRLAAYGFPLLLILVKMVMTEPSAVYFFMAAGLFFFTAWVRKIKNAGKISWKNSTLYSAVGVTIFELMANLGFWILGSCASETRLYAFNLGGLFETFRTSLPYIGLHFPKAVLLSGVLVQSAEWLRAKSPKLGLSNETI